MKETNRNSEFIFFQQEKKSSFEIKIRNRRRKAKNKKENLIQMKTKIIWRTFLIKDK